MSFRRCGRRFLRRWQFTDGEEEEEIVRLVDTTRDTLPSGSYKVLDEGDLDRRLVRLLTKHPLLGRNIPRCAIPHQQQEILLVRMPEARRKEKEQAQESVQGNRSTCTSSAASPSCPTSSPDLTETPIPQFNWTSSLAEYTGHHWLWFKYGPALAHLLNTTLKCELAIWMSPQFDAETLSTRGGPDYWQQRSKWAGPVLFKRKVEQQTAEPTEAKADPSGKPANLKLSAHSHPLLLYSSRYYGAFRCDLCKVGSPRQAYSCDACGWDCCLKCFADKGGYDPFPKPLPNPMAQLKVSPEDLLYAAHTLEMQPSYKFPLFERNPVSSSSSTANSDEGLLTFHKVLRWLHQQLGSDSSNTFDLDAALEASESLDRQSQVLCEGIQAVVELHYLARLFPEVWCFLHPSFLSKIRKPDDFAWIDELSGCDQAVDQFFCTMDPTVGLEQVDVEAAQARVHSIQSLLSQLHSAVRRRYHALSNSCLRFLPRSQLLELMKLGPSEQNLLGWHLKSRSDLRDAEEQQEQQLVRCNLAIFSHAIQSVNLPFSLLAICPDPGTTWDALLADSDSLWSEFGDVAEHRFNNSSGFFVPSGVNALEAVPPELIQAAKEWTDRTEAMHSGNNLDVPFEPTPEQIAESVTNSEWAPMCGGDQEMRHYNPDTRWANPCQHAQSAQKPIALHKMHLIGPPSQESSSWNCNLCRRNSRSARYTCIEHENDICLDCGRESQIKRMRSIADGFKAHRILSETRVIPIQVATSMAETSSMTILQTVVERENEQAAFVSTSSRVSKSAATRPKLWFDEFDLHTLARAFWDKSPTLQPKRLDAFLAELGESQKIVAQLIDFFNVSAAFNLASSEYFSLVDSTVQQLIPIGQHPSLTNDDVGRLHRDLPDRMYPTHEYFRRSSELPSLSSTSLDWMNSVNRATSSVLRSVHSRLSLANHGWKRIEITSQVHTDVLAQFRKPMVFGLLGRQHNDVSATAIIQQLVPCLARLFDRYYTEEAKAGRKVDEERKVQFFLKDEKCFLPNDLWKQLRKISPPPDGLSEGVLLLLPPVDSQELRVSNVPYLQPYFNVTYANDLHASPDDEQEGHELTLEPVIRAMHRILRDSTTGDSLFDVDVVLRLSAPIQEQSEVLERCVRLVESTMKLWLHHPRLDKRLRNKVGPSLPVDDGNDQLFQQLHGKFVRGLKEFGTLLEELEVDTMRSHLEPFERFTRLHYQHRQSYCSVQ